jgi:hypothetical protein
MSNHELQLTLPFINNFPVKLIPKFKEGKINKKNDKNKLIKIIPYQLVTDDEKNSILIENIDCCEYTQPNKNELSKYSVLNKTEILTLLKNFYVTKRTRFDLENIKKDVLEELEKKVNSSNSVYLVPSYKNFFYDLYVDNEIVEKLNISIGILE